MKTQEDDVQHYITRPMMPRIPPLAILVAGLVIGVLVGYAGRPLVTPQPPTPMPVTSTSDASPSTASDSSPQAGGADPSTLMDAVVAQTRHFKGDPNAPVTIVEFGDFQ